MQIQVKENFICLHLVTKFVAGQLSRCFNAIALFAQKDSHPLFSIDVLIGQFCSKWPGSRCKRAKALFFITSFMLEITCHNMTC